MALSRHMVFGIFLCALFLGVASLVSIFSRTNLELRTTPASVILFESPQESYGVVSSTGEHKGTEREAFIEKIRTSFTVDPFEHTEPEEQQGSEALGG